MSARGAVAAGHPITARAGADALRAGGNAVDAALAAMLASFVTESPLTGPGAGGYMLVHLGGRSTLLDFFVAAPGRGGHERRSELEAAEIFFTPTAPQTFWVGPAAIGVPGTLAGIEHAARRFGSMPLDELTRPAARLAREGFELDPTQAYFIEILEPILARDELIAATYAPGGRPVAAGERLRFPELADALERLGAEGAEPFYRGEVARALCDWVLERGGTLAPEDLAAYEAVEREPLAARFREREILTNPPPSAGGILIAFVLDVLDRAGAQGLEALVSAMDVAQSARTRDFLAGLHDPSFATRFLAGGRLDGAAERVRAGGPPTGRPGAAGRLGSTTHITAMDASGGCASVTCSNGAGSGVQVPGTGIHLNNMLGEQDLNPLGFHLHEAGRRLPSMMAPTLALAGGELEVALGSGGSNRIRSAITQTLIRLLAEGQGVEAAVSAPRVHCEDGVVQAEPGADAEALARLEQRGFEVVRWRERNVFFGGVHAVARDPATGELAGAGDVRRGGAVAYA
jgi:gamma-glutamyltranspeptidase / glutathione hydrolase